MTGVSQTRVAVGAVLVIAGTALAALHRSPIEQAIIAAFGATCLALGAWHAVRPWRALSGATLTRIMRGAPIVLAAFTLAVLGAKLAWIALGGG
jgi:hypothetical protein